MHETQRHIEATEAMRFSVPTGRPRRSQKQQENIMASFQNSCGFGIVVGDDEYADVLNNIAEATRL
jgi:hypothetical protein